MVFDEAIVSQLNYLHVFNLLGSTVVFADSVMGDFAGVWNDEVFLDESQDLEGIPSIASLREIIAVVDVGVGKLDIYSEVNF